MHFIREIASRRDLIRELVLKDLKIRYSRPMLGFFWAFLSPFLLVIIFYVVFSCILKGRIEEAPFFLYLMSAVFTWSFFADSVASSATSLVNNKGLIRESGFPHYLIPLSIVLANAIVFLPSLIILTASSFFVLKGLPLSIVWLPVVLFSHLIMTIGFSVIFSIAYVRCRDIKYALDLILTLLFYFTPAFYSLRLVKEAFPKPLFAAYIYNPFVGILNFYRTIILKGFHAFIAADVTFISMAVVPLIFGLLVVSFSLWLYENQKDKINDYLSY